MAPAKHAQRPEPPPRLIADFRAGVSDLASFPRGDWVWATREACGSVATADLDYGDPRGCAELRRVIAGYLRRVRAAAAERRVGLYGISGYRADGTAGPPQLVIGFGNVGERAVEPGIAAVADLLR